MLYLPVSQTWLLSRLAQRIYLACAVLNLALIATFLGIITAITASHAAGLTPWAAAVVKIVLFPEVIGTALLWVAMWYFWFNLDSSGYFKRSFWFLCLILLGWLIPAFYYFIVYRSSLLKNTEFGSASA